VADDVGVDVQVDGLQVVLAVADGARALADSAARCTGGPGRAERPR
jgi:hypothetical protein